MVGKKGHREGKAVSYYRDKFDGAGGGSGLHLSASGSSCSSYPSADCIKRNLPESSGWWEVNGTMLVSFLAEVQGAGWGFEITHDFILTGADVESPAC